MSWSALQLGRIPVSEVARPAGTASCDPFESLLGAVARLMEADIDALPVLAHDGSRRPVGWLTARDFARAVARDPEGLSALQVRSALSPAASRCRLDETLEQALERMRCVGADRLPVVDASGRLCGVLTLENIAARIASDRIGQATALERAICETLAARGGEACGVSTSKT